MTAVAATPPSSPSIDSGGSAPAGWENLLADGDIQFAPVTIPEIPPRVPGWFERLLNDVFAFLGEWLAPLGAALGASWWWLQWVLLGAAVLFAGLLLVRLIAPLPGRQSSKAGDVEAEAWRPDAASTLALLGDADRLAAEAALTRRHIFSSSAASARSPPRGPIGWSLPAPPVNSLLCPRCPMPHAVPSV